MTDLVYFLYRFFRPFPRPRLRDGTACVAEKASSTRRCASTRHLPRSGAAIGAFARIETAAPRGPFQGRNCLKLKLKLRLVTSRWPGAGWDELS